MRGTFSDIHDENLVELLEVKFMKVRGFSNAEPPGVCNSQTSLPSASSNLSNFPLNCSVPVIGSEASALGKLNSAVILCTHLSLQELGWWFALSPHFYNGSNKIHRFLVYSFLFL